MNQTKKTFSLGLLHKIGKSKIGHPISVQVLLNAVGEGVYTYAELAEMYGVDAIASRRDYQFISDLVGITNRRSIIPLFRTGHHNRGVYCVSLTNHGLNLLAKLDDAVFGLPERGYLQKVFWKISKEHSLPFNALAAIEAVGDGALHTEISAKFGVNTWNAREYGFISDLLCNVNKRSGGGVFDTKRVPISELEGLAAERDKAYWLSYTELTERGRRVLSDIRHAA